MRVDEGTMCCVIIVGTILSIFSIIAIAFMLDNTGAGVGTVMVVCLPLLTGILSTFLGNIYVASKCFSSTKKGQ